MSIPASVPCGIHTMGEPRTERGWLTSYACGGTCHLTSIGDTLGYYRCDRCTHGTSRRLDGRPEQAWDGMLRDGSSYFDEAPDEHDWRL